MRSPADCSPEGGTDPSIRRGPERRRCGRRAGRDPRPSRSRQPSRWSDSATPHQNWKSSKGTRHEAPRHRRPARPSAHPRHRWRVGCSIGTGTAPPCSRGCHGCRCCCCRGYRRARYYPGRRCWSATRERAHTTNPKHLPAAERARGRRASGATSASRRRPGRSGPTSGSVELRRVRCPKGCPGPDRRCFRDPNHPSAGREHQPLSNGRPAPPNS